MEEGTKHEVVIAVSVFLAMVLTVAWYGEMKMFHMGWYSMVVISSFLLYFMLWKVPRMIR